MQCNLSSYFSNELKYQSIYVEIFRVSINLDYAGIGTNMAFNPIPVFYYAFYCDPKYSMLYIGTNMITGFLSFLCSLSDWIHQAENAKIKILVFSLSGVPATIGLTHLLIRQFTYHNFGDPYTVVPSLYLFLVTVLCYATGFYTYMIK